MKRYRARKRAAGMKLIQLWVPDTSSPAFRRRLNRQMERLRNHPSEMELLDFLDDASADWFE